MTKILKFLLPFVMVVCTSAAQTQGTAPATIVNRFSAEVNKHDIQQIANLIQEDNVFIDPSGNVIRGGEKVKKEWQDYFAWFPDYRMEITSTFINKDTVALMGFASGSYHGASKRWQVPASWRAVVHNGKIVLWQSYADTRIPFDAMEKTNDADDSQPRVTGIGGFFFKCKEPGRVKAWYQQHLHMKTDKYGTNFEWRQSENPGRKGFTQWSPFVETTTYFAPSSKDHMINYRVANMDKLLAELKKDGVTVLDTPAAYDYGKFVHILDCENNKIELWEPIDSVYNKLVDARTR